VERAVFSSDGRLIAAWAHSRQGIGQKDEECIADVFEAGRGTRIMRAEHGDCVTNAASAMGDAKLVTTSGGFVDFSSFPIGSMIHPSFGKSEPTSGRRGRQGTPILYEPHS
jgi:hypothetical protein